MFRAKVIDKPDDRSESLVGMTRLWLKYNKIKGESEWNENKQRDFNKKLEDLLENDGEKKKPGQRSPSDNPTTWWNWEALDQKAPN